MEKLKEVRNYLVIHNGNIQTQQIQDHIEINENNIIIYDSTQLQIIYTSNECQLFNVFIDIKKNINVDLIEIYQLQNQSQYQKEINIEQNSHVTRYVENDCLDGQYILHDHVQVGQDASIDCAYVELSNYSTKSKMKYDLNKPGARALVRLASLASNEKKKEYQISLCHHAPNTYGDMDNYGVVKSHSSLIIDGIGKIEKGNYQSDTHQTNKIIVFDDGCIAEANPYLYIDEYDVKASHGASVGKIDEDHLYYLQSRGLTKQDAMHLVTYGYFLPVLNFIHVDSLKDRFNEVMKEKVGL